MTEAMNRYCRCGHLDGDHNTEGDYCFKESANGPCPCVRFAPEIATQPEVQHPQEPPMTDHTDLEDVTKALLAIADAIRGLTPNAAQDAAGCPQNDPQPEPGRLDGDGAAEAGEDDWERNHFAYIGHDGKHARTWTLTDLRQFIPISDPATPFSIPQRFVFGTRQAGKASAVMQELVARAEKAELERDEAYDRMRIAVGERHEVAEERDKCRAERDAILADLRAAFRNWTHDAGYPIASGIAEIINRHTPEG